MERNKVEEINFFSICLDLNYMLKTKWPLMLFMQQRKCSKLFWILLKRGWCTNNITLLVTDVFSDTKFL